MTIDWLFAPTDNINLLIEVAVGLVATAWVAGYWSKRKLQAWLSSEDSKPYVERITKPLLGEVAGVRTQVRAEVEALRTALSGQFESSRASLGYARSEFASRCEALSKQALEIEARIGGRFPSDIGGLMDTKLRDFEQRIIVREARVEEQMRKDRLQIAELLGHNPQIAASPQGRQLLQNLNLAALPKKYQKYVAYAQALGVVPAGAMSAAPGNGAGVMAGATPPPPAAHPPASPPLGGEGTGGAA